MSRSFLPIDLHWGRAIMVHRGTAKSTALRGLADRLPKIDACATAPTLDPLMNHPATRATRALKTAEALPREQVPYRLRAPLGATEAA